MFSLFKKKSKSQPVTTKTGVRQYRQVAVTPQAHAKLHEISSLRNRSIIDTVDHLVGV